MPGDRTFRASPLSRDLRSFGLPGLGLLTSSGLAVAYVLGAGESFSVVAGLLATAAICTGAVAHGRARVRRLAPTDVRLTEKSLTIGESHIARRDLVHGVVVPVEDGALVQLRSSRLRQPLVLHFEDTVEANALLAELGLGVDDTTATFLTQSPWLAKRWFANGLIGLCLGVFSLSVLVIPLGWPPIIAVTAIAMLLLPILFVATPASLHVGLDGLRYAFLGKRQFFSWSSIERVIPYRAKSITTDSGGVEIVIEGRAEPLRIPMGTDALVGDTPERLAARIEQAKRAAESARSDGLELKGSMPDRVRAAKAVLEGDGGYREAHVDPFAVSAILADPTASAEARIAAAVAIAGSSPDGPEKIRIAAKTTADVSVRAALEAVASEEAMAVVEAAVARASITGRRERSPRR